MCFLLSYEQIEPQQSSNEHALVKMDFGIFLSKMSKVVNNCFLNLYIIKKLGRSFKKMFKNYRVIIINWKFCNIFFVNTKFLRISCILTAAFT